MYCSRTLTPSGGRAEQLRGGALGAMPTTKKVLTRAEAKAMALREGVEQVVLTQDVDDMQRAIGTFLSIAPYATNVKITRPLTPKHFVCERN